MRKGLAILPVLIGLLCLFAGCANKDSERPAAADSIVQNLSAAFAANGYQVTYAQASKSVLDGARSILTLSNEAEEENVQLYIYPTVALASDDLDRVSDDGFSYNITNGIQNEAVCISWVDHPHFYIKDNTIVLYVGSNNNICNILCDICGEQVKGM